MDESAITTLDISAVESLGSFGDIAYERVWGVARGVVAAHEDVVGLDRLPSPYEYASEFEVLQPVDRAQRTAVVVDAENRGGPSMLGAVTGVGLRGTAPSVTTYPDGMGAGCLFDTGLSYRGSSGRPSTAPASPPTRRASASWWCATLGGILPTTSR